MAIKIKNKKTGKWQIIILTQILHIAEKKLTIKTSPFFMNRAGWVYPAIFFIISRVALQSPNAV